MKATKYFLFLIFFFCLLVSFSFFDNQVLAVDNLGDAFSGDQLDEIAGKAGYGTGESSTVEGMIGRILIAAFSLLGVIFMILIIYGGVLWMTDRGNEEQVGKAKKLITAAVIGLIIVLVSYAFSYFVLRAAYLVI